MMSFFLSTLLLVATGATAGNWEFSYDVILLEYLATGYYWLLQVLQLARSLAMTLFFWSTLRLVATGATARKEFGYNVILLEYLATGCYRCYSLQGVYL